MSLLRKPDDHAQIKPVIPTHLPSNLDALKSAFKNELKSQEALLGKIMQNIHNTVKKMHADPDEMWLRIDFQAEAIDQIIHMFCTDIHKVLESKGSPESIEEEVGIQNLVNQLHWDLSNLYCVEEYVEKLLNELGKKEAEPASPSQFLKPVNNPFIHAQDYHIVGYPGLPLPTNAWWELLADKMGSGLYCMTVVEDTASIENPLTHIHFQDAQRFEPTAKIGERINIPCTSAYLPNVNQGCYLIKNNAHGLEFSQSELFSAQINTDGNDFLLQQMPYTLVASAAESLSTPPTITSYDDHSATLLYKGAEGASMTAPIVRGSPYITLLYRQSTPLIHASGLRIAPQSIRAYAYHLVVADINFTDPSSQIKASAAISKGYDAQIGNVILLENTNELSGQVFTFTLLESHDTYYVFSSVPIAFKTVHVLEKTVLPVGSPIETEQFIANDGTKAPYSTILQYVQDAGITGLEATERLDEVMLRIAKVPSASIQSGQDEEAARELLEHAWIYATGGSYTVTGMGSWQYTYATTQVDPYFHLNINSASLLKPQSLLIALLKPDFASLKSTPPAIDLFYETIRGPARFVIAENEELLFFHGAGVQAAAWPDLGISKLTEQQRVSLVHSYIRTAEQIDIKTRGGKTYDTAKAIQNAADAAHAMFVLLQHNTTLIDHTEFMAAFQASLCIAKAGLDDYLSGGFLEYDEQNKMVVTTLAQATSDNDSFNAYGQDHHRSYGYLIRAAAAIRDITPDWFNARRVAVVGFMINDVCCSNDQSSHFPKMRMWDPYIGIGRATGTVTPQRVGMSEETIAEDYNCLQGIALWAKRSRNKELEAFAVTLAGRVQTAAQAFWQSNSAISMYTEPTAPHAFKEFAQDTLCCSLNADTQSSSQNTQSYQADPHLIALSLQSMTDHLDFIDEKTAVNAFEYLFHCDLKSFNLDAFLNHFGHAILFQNKVRYKASAENPIGSAMSCITLLIPLIAKVSPRTAHAVLEWYLTAHERNPSDYPFHALTNYAKLQMQVFIAMQTKKDPVTSPITLNYWPSIPDGAGLNPLQYWKEKAQDWVESKHLSSDGLKLAESLHTQIQTLINYKGTIQDMHMWARSMVLPTLGQNYPGTTYNELYRFCAITQTDPQEALQSMPARTETTPPAPKIEVMPVSTIQNSKTYLAEVPQPYSIDSIFAKIKSEITSYLSERTINLYQAEAYLGHPQAIPSTDADWRKLASTAQSKLQQLQNDIASCRSPGHWTALAAKHGFKGSLQQIQKQAALILHLLSDIFSARLSLSSFTQAISKISALELSEGSIQDLENWAREFNTSGLTPQDLVVWKHLEGEPSI